MRSMRSCFIIQGKASFTKIPARLFAVFICLWIDAELVLKARDGFAIDLEQDENC